MLSGAAVSSPPDPLDPATNILVFRCSRVRSTPCPKRLRHDIYCTLLLHTGPTGQGAGRPQDWPNFPCLVVLGSWFPPSLGQLRPSTRNIHCCSARQLVRRVLSLIRMGLRLCHTRNPRPRVYGQPQQSRSPWKRNENLGTTTPPPPLPSARGRHNSRRLRGWATFTRLDA